MKWVTNRKRSKSMSPLDSSEERAIADTAVAVFDETVVFLGHFKGLKDPRVIGAKPRAATCISRAARDSGRGRARVE